MDEPREDVRPVTVVASGEARQMIEWAQGVLHGFDGRRHSRAEALDWLLRDSCEYGSPVVGAQARKVWPDSVEAREWDRKRQQRIGSLAANPRHIGSDVTADPK